MNLSCIVAMREARAKRGRERRPRKREREERRSGRFNLLSRGARIDRPRTRRPGQPGQHQLKHRGQEGTRQLLTWSSAFLADRILRN